MPKYTTGEVAGICGVTVRTVQYYDSRGILIPSELSEGGRRLYSEDDVRRMKLICFLRDLGLSIDSISQILSGEDPGSVISLLLDEQEKLLKREIGEREETLEKIAGLKTGLRAMDGPSLESIGDMALVMTNRKKLKKLHILMLLTGIPVAVLQISSVILWITAGIWWLFAVWAAVAVVYAVLLSGLYFRKTAFICPRCHEVFRVSVRDGLWSTHTFTARKLTCPLCGYRGFCVETAAEGEVKYGE